MSVSASVAVEHYHERREQALEALSWYDELQAKVRAVGARSDAEHQAACLELARAYQQSMDAAALARVESLTGYLGFKRHDPLKAMEHERHVLETTIKRIENEDRYRRREELAGPDGTIRSEIAQAKEMLEPFENECAKFESLVGFDELVEVGYDTPEFAGRFWQADYWRHWAAGDRICKELGMDDFGDDVLPAYWKVAQQRNFWKDELARHESALVEIHQLVQKHDEAQARLPGLAAVYLAGCQEQLAKHLAGADIGLLEEWRQRGAPHDRGLEMALRKVSGLRAKSNMLRALHDQAVATAVQDLRERESKYARKASKFGRPKYWNRAVAESELDPKFGDKLPKLQDRVQKLEKMVDRIDRYDDYQRFSLENDQSLWWYEFTRSRPPRELSRLRNYYDRHPELEPVYDERFDDDHDAAAVALAAADMATPRPDVGYIS